jgi:hypothetical protein
LVSLLKLNPARCGARSEVICETSRRVVTVPVVVEPVPVDDDLTVVHVDVRDVEVAIAVTDERTECRLCHHPLNALKVESYSASIMP